MTTEQRQEETIRQIQWNLGLANNLPKIRTEEVATTGKSSSYLATEDSYHQRAILTDLREHLDGKANSVGVLKQENTERLGLLWLMSADPATHELIISAVIADANAPRSYSYDNYHAQRVAETLLGIDPQLEATREALKKSPPEKPNAVVGKIIRATSIMLGYPDELLSPEKKLQLLNSAWELVQETQPGKDHQKYLNIRLLRNMAMVFEQQLDLSQIDGLSRTGFLARAISISEADPETAREIIRLATTEEVETVISASGDNENKIADLVAGIEYDHSEGKEGLANHTEFLAQLPFGHSKIVGAVIGKVTELQAVFCENNHNWKKGVQQTDLEIHYQVLARQIDSVSDQLEKLVTPETLLAMAESHSWSDEHSTGRTSYQEVACPIIRQLTEASTNRVRRQAYQEAMVQQRGKPRISYGLLLLLLDAEMPRFLKHKQGDEQLPRWLQLLNSKRRELSYEKKATLERIKESLYPKSSFTFVEACLTVGRIGWLDQIEIDSDHPDRVRAADKIAQREFEQTRASLEELTTKLEAGEKVEAEKVRTLIVELRLSKLIDAGTGEWITEAREWRQEIVARLLMAEKITFGIKQMVATNCFHYFLNAGQARTILRSLSAYERLSTVEARYCHRVTTGEILDVLTSGWLKDTAIALEPLLKLSPSERETLNRDREIMQRVTEWINQLLTGDRAIESQDKTTLRLLNKEPWITKIKKSRQLKWSQVKALIDRNR